MACGLTISTGCLVSFLSRLNLTYSYLNATSWLQPILKLPSLQELSLRYCGLGDVVLSPALFVNSSLPSLTTLDLPGNKLTSSAFDWLFNMSTSLVSLNLGFNALNGILPDRFGRFVSLEYLDLSLTGLEGEIPKSLGNLSHLQNVSLGGNSLGGSLEGLFRNVSCSLEIVVMSYNQFTGPIPDMAACTSLQILLVGSNNLTGTLPASIGQLSDLRALDVSNISWIGGSNYRYLILARNRFHGSIPAGICDFMRIRILDLSRNNFSGQIPDCFNNFASMRENTKFSPFVGTFGFLYYNIPIPLSYLKRDNVENTFVQWKGKEAEYRRTLGYLKLIDLSSNEFIGRIPRSLSTLKGLISLNLSRNSFTGDIIPDVGRMTNLECLDLSSNHLSGHIPNSLAELTFLSVLDLSNNNLYGKIPSSTQLQSFTASAYAGNLGLCGIPLITPCVVDGSSSINHHHHSHISLSFMQEVFISMTSGFIIGFWGIVGSLVLNKLWRRAYFSFWDNIGRWVYVNTAILLNKFRRW